MQGIKKRLQQAFPTNDRFQLLKAFESLFNTQALASGGLTFTTTTWQTANVIPYQIANVTFTKAVVVTQAVPASITWGAVASTFQAGAFVIAVDNVGTISTYTSAVTSSVVTAAAALGLLVWPQVPDTVCVIGQILIQSTTAATAFTPGVTALNAIGITTTFINTVGPFFPVAPI